MTRRSNHTFMVDLRFLDGSERAFGPLPANAAGQLVRMADRFQNAMGIRSCAWTETKLWHRDKQGRTNLEGNQ